MLSFGTPHGFCTAPVYFGVWAEGSQEEDVSCPVFLMVESILCRDVGMCRMLMCTDR